MRRLIILIYILIIYGSLFPFNFSILEFSQQYSSLLSVKISGIGDILANIALFMPLGFLYSIYLPEIKTHHSADNWMLWFKVFTFSIVLQVLQIALPNRDQNITDVVFNMLGFMFAYYVMAFISFPKFHIRPTLKFLPMVIALVYILSELSPFVPSLDFQQVKTSIKPLLIWPTWAISRDVFFEALMWLVVIRLVSFQQIKPPLKWLFMLWLGMLLAKIMIYNNQVNYSDLIAPLLAMLISISVNVQQQNNSKILLIIVLFIFTITSFSAITSFHFMPSTLLPFYGYLSGQLVVSIQGLLYKMFLFSSIIWLALELSMNAKKTTYVLAGYVGVIELSQLFMSDRVTDFADIFLVFIAYLLVRHLGDYLVQQETFYQDNLNNEMPKKPLLGCVQSKTNKQRLDISPAKQFIVTTVAIYLVFYCLIHFSLTLPGVPYNVVELFSNDASALSLLFFSIFLLLLGGGSAHIANTIDQDSDIAVTKFVGLHLLVLFIIFTCLWFAVTNESIEDIVGASKVKQAIYAGQTSHHFIMVLLNVLSLSLMASIAQFFDFLLRFAALFGLIQVPLTLCFICFSDNIRISTKIKLAIVSLFLLILCYLVVFTFSVTDNLTELIASPVYFVIGLVFFTLTVAFSKQLLIKKSFLLVVFLTLIIAGISWPIAQYIFNQVIIKYGHVFSAFDFLIGAGREQSISEQALLLRWGILIFVFQWILIIGSLFMNKIPKLLIAQSQLNKMYNYVGVFVVIMTLSYIGNRLFGEHMHWQTLTQHFSHHSQQSFTVDESTAVIPDDAVEGIIYLNGKSMGSLAEAFKQAKPQDVIRLSKGHYNEAAILIADNVSIIAEVGAVIFGKTKEGKGALVIKGDNTYIEGLECHSIYVPDNNGVCIRLEGKGIYLNNVYLHHAQGGLLGSHKGGDIHIENSRFEHLGDGAFYHGIYTLKETRLFINNSYFLNNRNGGHEIKSRSFHTEITNSVIASSQSRDSRLIDVPNGGGLIIRNNILVEGPFSENHDLLSWGVEGIKHQEERVIIEGNTIISDKNRASLISMKRSPAILSILDNVVIGDVDGLPKEENLFFDNRVELSIPAAPFIPEN